MYFLVVNRVPFYGSAILRLDEPNVQAMLPSVKRPVITYGTTSQADFVISDVKLKDLRANSGWYRGEDLGIFDLPRRREFTMFGMRLPRRPWRCL